MSSDKDTMKAGSVMEAKGMPSRVLVRMKTEVGAELAWILVESSDEWSNKLEFLRILPTTDSKFVFIFKQPHATYARCFRVISLTGEQMNVMF